MLTPEHYSAFYLIHEERIKDRLREIEHQRLLRVTGPGLSAEELKSLFQEFQRLGSSSGTAGTGLGLAISRRLARLLGGDIVVRSLPGTGSTFTLLLPIVEGVQVFAPAAPGRDLPVPPPLAPS